ncbi:hypothetical protein PIB30_039609 [Stylosanthes scabra]|uniref:Uncharacterized protein n=1 Tax=Stylosanthes scabra TaxID=79078 RepID=A0ABU6QE17_9FABA|nr:hypothetical protein [Stylosanthes scabra]
MGGESSSRKGTKTQCRRSRRIAALYRTTNQVSEEHEVIAINDDSKHKEDTKLEMNEVLPTAEGGAKQNLPKNDVYVVLWAMLDAESENEAKEISGQWDLDSVLHN